MVRWNRRFKHLCTLSIGVLKKSHLHFALCFSDDITKWCKVYTKLTPGFENHMRDLDNFRRAMKRPTRKSLMDYISSAKQLYAEDLSNITFNYFCENSPNFWCHFPNHKSFSQRNSSLLFQLKQYIFSTKVAHKSTSFQTFHFLQQKSPKSSCHFSNKKSVFLQSLCHYSVAWEITFLYFFSWNFICYW